MRWVGARINRKEDPKLLTGGGRFVADIDMPGMLHCGILRSSEPHAVITSIDVEAALAVPGVHAIYTPDDLVHRLDPIPVIWREELQNNRSNPVVPTDNRVRFVGEPLGIVVADSRYIAEDALELIEVEYESLPPVVDVEDAMADGATLLHPDWGDNVACEYHSESASGDASDDALPLHEQTDVDKVFAAADHVFDRRFKIGRHTAFPMETRGCIAHVDPITGQLVLTTSTQTPHFCRTVLAGVLRHPEKDIRVIAPDVGGGFGQKEHLYPEEALVAIVALDLQRPAKWIEDRRENFLAGSHARQQLVDLSMAVTAEGKIVGTKLRVVADIGGYCSNIGIGPALSTNSMLPQAYTYKAHRGDVYAVTTNKTPAGAYRGFGMNKSVLLIERMVDIVAHEMGIDPADMRMRNLAAPVDMPFTSATGHTYDAGDYPRSLQGVLDAVDYRGLREEQARLREEGRYLGIGICHYVEINGLGPSKVMHMSGFEVGGYETGVVEVQPDGTVVLATGVTSHGQAHQTTLAQIVADQLGVHPDKVTVVQGDTSNTPYSPSGTIASRSAPNAGGSAMLAAKKVREKILKVASHLLEVGVEDLKLEDERIFAQGAPSVGMSLADVAAHMWGGRDLGDDSMEFGAQERVVYDPPGTSYTFGSQVCVIELDPETGTFEWRRYFANHDCGTMINPMVVDGQMHGGIAQGIAGVTLEDLVYDESGQPITTTFMDYLLPTASDMPKIEMTHTETPSPYNPLGIKGMGEGGTMSGMPVIANALADALAPFNVEVTEFPLTPNRLFAKVYKEGRRDVTAA
jgi:carbon-monoxide dehydrogenase large subunit